MVSISKFAPNSAGLLISPHLTQVTSEQECKFLLIRENIRLKRAERYCVLVVFESIQDISAYETWLRKQGDKGEQTPEEGSLDDEYATIPRFVGVAGDEVVPLQTYHWLQCGR